jgi:hypothetical protein
MTSKDYRQGGDCCKVNQILLGVLLGLLFLLGLECRILLGVGLLLACMGALEGTIYKQVIEATGINQANIRVSSEACKEQVGCLRGLG